MEGCPEGCPCPNWDCDAPPPGQVSLKAICPHKTGCFFRESDCKPQFQCDDIDDNDDFHRCEDGLAEELSKCFESCGGVSACIIACSTDYENGLKDCPCMEGCPGGCPCENWDCTLQVCRCAFDLANLINVLVWS